MNLVKFYFLLAKVKVKPCFTTIGGVPLEDYRKLLTYFMLDIFDITSTNAKITSNRVEVLTLKNVTPETTSLFSFFALLVGCVYPTYGRYPIKGFTIVSVWGGHPI
jgi:hypothetical protein